MTAFQNNPLGEGKTGKYLLTPFYLVPFIVEFCLLRMLTFSLSSYVIQPFPAPQRKPEPLWIPSGKCSDVQM